MDTRADAPNYAIFPRYQCAQKQNSACTRHMIFLFNLFSFSPSPPESRSAIPDVRASVALPLFNSSSVKRNSVNFLHKLRAFNGQSTALRSYSFIPPTHTFKSRFSVAGSPNQHPNNCKQTSYSTACTRE